MSCTSCLRGTLLVAAALAMPLAPACAAPIRYTLDFTVEWFRGDDILGLDGAAIHEELVWDAATLLPDFNGDDPFGEHNTWWPLTNTTALVTISGSASSDGLYVGTPSNLEWIFQDDVIRASGPLDTNQPAFVTIDIQGHTVEIQNGYFAFPASFNTPAPPDGPIFPYAFPTTIAFGDGQPAFVVLDGNVGGVGEDLTGRAEFLTAVPEPSTLTLLGIGTTLACVHRLRRRQRRCVPR